MVSYTSLWRTVRDQVNHMRLPFLTPQNARAQAGNELLYDTSSDLVYEAPLEHPFGPGYITSNILQESEEEHREDDDRGQEDDDEVSIAETDYILKADEESKDHFNPHQDYIPFDSPSDGEQSNEKKENAKENDNENLNDNEGQVDYILMVKTTSRSAQREEECDDYIPLDLPTQETATQKLDTSDSEVEYVRPKKITKISAQREEHDYIPLNASSEESAANSIEDSGYVSISENSKSQKAAEPILRAPSESSDRTASTIPAIPRPRRPVRHRMICDNCNHVGHRYMQCIEPCILCGNPKHRSPECEKAIQQKEKDERKSSPKKRKTDDNSEAERMKKRIRVLIEGESDVDEGLRDGRKVEDLRGAGAENGDFEKMDGIAEKGNFYPGLDSTAQNAEKSKRSKKRSADYDEEGDFAAPTKRARLSNESQSHKVYPGYTIYRGGYNLYPGSRAVYPSENLFREGYSHQPFVNSGPVRYTYSSQVPYPEYGFEFVHEGRATNTSASAYPTYNSYNTRHQATHNDGYFSYKIGNEQEIRDVKPRANNESACLSPRQDHVDDDGNAYDDLEWEEWVKKLEATNKRVEEWRANVRDAGLDPNKIDYIEID